MTESVMSSCPPSRCLCASCRRRCGKLADQLVREPLADAVDQRRRVIIPQLCDDGHACHKNRMALIGETYHGDTVVMMVTTPSCHDAGAAGLSRTSSAAPRAGSVRHLLQSARIARANGMGRR